MTKSTKNTLLWVGGAFIAWQILKPKGDGVGKASIGADSRWHPKDDLLRGITYEDLIITVQSNEPEINESSVRRVFKEIKQAALHDAEVDLTDNMSKILKAAR